VSITLVAILFIGSALAVGIPIYHAAAQLDAINEQTQRDLNDSPRTTPTPAAESNSEPSATSVRR
jgi:hypothetical protein